MNEPTDFQCSIIHDALDTAPRAIGFRDAISGIRTGRWASLVETVRSAYQNGGKESASAPKKKLPGILFSGTFERRASSALSRASGLICADLDDLKESTETWFEQITADPHTLACFRSPTNTGLKVVFRCDPAKDHKESYDALEHYMLEHFGLQIDEKCSDVSRICFVSHDRELFEADDAEVIPYPPKAAPTAKEFILPQRNGSDLSAGDDFNLRGGASVPDILTSFGWTQLRGKYWCRPGKTGEVSASWEHIPNTLIVFSNAPETGFPPERKGFDPFAIFTHLRCSGDFKAAYQALTRQGYGSVQKSRVLQNHAPEEKEPEQSQATPDAKLQKKLLLLARRVKVSSPPAEPVTRLYLADKPVCTPGNITTLTAKAKTGKTAALGAATAAIITAAVGTQSLDHDTFKFRAANPEGHAVIIFDTEQSPYDAYLCYKRSLSRAGTDEDPAWLHHYSLVGCNAKQLHEALDLAIEIALETHQGIFIIILDGVADFVNSVNDEAESNQCVSWLQDRAVSNNCPIVCVIHTNEGEKAGNDSRGHIGKQLIRKAESNLLLKKTNDITTITSDRQRQAPISLADGVAFKWSDEHKHHVTCEVSEPGSKGGRPKGSTFQSLETIWPRTAETALTQSQLLKFAKDEEEISEPTLRRIINGAVSDGLLVKTPSSIGNKYHLRG